MGMKYLPGCAWAGRARQDYSAARSLTPQGGRSTACAACALSRPTYVGLGSNHSSSSSHPTRQIQKGHPQGDPFVFGAPDRIRTCDLWLRRPTLYPSELRAQNYFVRWIASYREPAPLSRRSTLPFTCGEGPGHSPACSRRSVGCEPCSHFPRPHPSELRAQNYFVRWIASYREPAPLSRRSTPR